MSSGDGGDGGAGGNGGSGTIGIDIDAGGSSTPADSTSTGGNQ